MEEKMDRRGFLRRSGEIVVGAAAAGVGVEEAQAAEMKVEKGLDIDKQLAAMETEGEKFLATVRHLQELRKNPDELQGAGDFFKNLGDLDDQGVAILKLTRFKHNK
jgi:hypothetical protein